MPEHVADLTLQECRWADADLSGRRLTGLRCRDTRFVHCDLSGAVLEDAVLSRVTFVDCRLTGIVLGGAELTDVRITDSQADLASLRMARASYTVIENTSLRGADFYEFTGADCGVIGCDLTGASFQDARLTAVHTCTARPWTTSVARSSCAVPASVRISRSCSARPCSPRWTSRSPTTDPDDLVVIAGMPRHAGELRDSALERSPRV